MVDEDYLGRPVGEVRSELEDLGLRVAVDRSSGGGEVISRHSAVFHEQIVGDGYGPLVAAESRLLGQAAVAIARSLR